MADLDWDFAIFLMEVQTSKHAALHTQSLDFLTCEIKTKWPKHGVDKRDDGVGAIAIHAKRL